jgi:hypothetical protein
VGWIRVLIWVGDLDNMDIGRRLDPSDLLACQLLRGGGRFSTVQFVTRPVPNGLRRVHFGMGDGKGQGCRKAKVKAAHGGLNRANCAVPTAEDAAIWGRITQTAQNSGRSVQFGDLGVLTDW